MKEEYFHIPWETGARRLRNSWIPFVVYSFLYIFLRNLLLQEGVLEGVPYTTAETLQILAGALVLRSPGGLLGTFWFVPVLVLTTAAVLGLMHITESLKHKEVIRIAAAACLGIIGIMLNYKEIGLEYHMHTAFLMIPVMFAGYYFKQYEASVMRFVHPLIGLLCGVFVYRLQRKMNLYIELSDFHIMTPLWFYPVIFMGLYLCLALGRLLLRSKMMKKLFSQMGCYSFDIMALQFLVFKGIDYIYAHMGMGDMEVLIKFPYAYSELRLLYYMGGVLIPVLIRKGFDAVTTKILLAVK